MSSIVTVLGIPNIFIHHLYMEGWLMPDLSRRSATAAPQRQCDGCKKALSLTERIYCDNCREEIAQRLQQRPRPLSPEVNPRKPKSANVRRVKTKEPEAGI